MLSHYARQGLDDRQIAHLRHFNNLSRQLPNEWSLMKGKGYGQEDFGGYRFQLAYMAYALALTHKHRLPAAPGLFKPIFETADRKNPFAGSLDVLARREPRRKRLQRPSCHKLS